MGGNRIKPLAKCIEEILLALHYEEYEKAASKIEELSHFSFEELSPFELSSLSKQIEYILHTLQTHKNSIKEELAAKEQLKKYSF